MSLPHSFLSGKGGGAKDWIYSGISSFNQSATHNGPQPSSIVFDYISGGNQSGSVKVSSDGTKMMGFEYGGNSTGVSSYDLSTPFNITTAWRSNNYSMNNIHSTSGVTSVNTSWDGKYLYAVHDDRQSISTWYLPSPWSFGGALWVNTSYAYESNCQACGISEDGITFWTYHRYTDKLYNYTLDTPFDFHTPTGNETILSKSNTNWKPWGNTNTGNIYGMYVAQDGKTLTFHDMSEGTSGLYTWSLSTPFDFTTLHSAVYNHIEWANPGNAMGLDIHKDWMYVIDAYHQGKLRQVSINTN
jgi:hypothetical protein